MRTIITERAGRRQTTSADLAAQRDSGHTGVEMVAVLAIVGILASVVAMMITGMTTQAAASTCSADARMLDAAAMNYLAIEHTGTIPATGSDQDRYERTLAAQGFLRAPSDHFDLAADGVVLTPEGSSC